MGAFLPLLGPSMRIFTYRCKNSSASGSPLIGQVTFAHGTTCARLSFLAPENAMELSDLSALTDHMAAQMGERGAFHIIADVDESSPVYRLLRRAGFAIYARQSIWRLDGQANGDPGPLDWRATRAVDLIKVRSLYNDVVPGLVQQVEPQPKKTLQGFVHYDKDNLCAYVELKHGRYGLWIQPYVHPDVQGFDRQLVQLLANLPKRGQRPLYICIRSYQSWLESALEASGAQPGPRQAVMVRHLTIAQRVKQTYPLPAINGKHVEPTAPLTRIEKNGLMEFSEVEKHS
jgi:hypothetical protein